MKRRDLIAILGGAGALMWSRRIRAQPPQTPVVGFLHPASPAPYADMIAAFQRGLGEEGFEEGRNVALDFRWAGGHFDMIDELEAELLARPVSVLTLAGPSAEMIKRAGTTPVVFVTGADPVKFGLVPRLNQTGGTVTGISIFTGPLDGKRLGLLRALLPKAQTIAVVAHEGGGGPPLGPPEEAVTSGGQKALPFNVDTPDDLDKAFATAADQHADAVLIESDPFMTSQRDRVVALGLRYALPAIFPLREYAGAGGLMSYGASIDDSYRQTGAYVGRVLKGEKPGDLPVQLPTRFQFVINLKTAKALGLTIPSTLLALADEVIE